MNTINPRQIFFVTVNSLIIVSLYFQEISKIALPVFLIWLLYNLYHTYHDKKTTIMPALKWWLFVSFVYASVLIFSFLLRPPYTDDGIWRISAPVFIIFLVGWAYITARLNWWLLAMKTIAISSLISAIVAFVYELYLYDWSVEYRFGLSKELDLLSQIGFCLPLASSLFLVLFMEKKNKLYLLGYIASYILVSLAGSRTGLVMQLMPILVLAFYYLFLNKNFSKRRKSLVLLLLLFFVIIITFLSQKKIKEIFIDYNYAKQGYFSTSLGLRYVQNIVGWQIAKENLIFGVGQNQYKNILRQELQDNPDYNDTKNQIINYTHIHNQFLMDLILIGISGILGLLAFIFYPLLFIIKNKKEIPTNSLLILTGISLGVVFVLLFGAIFTYTYTTISYVMIISSLIGFSSKK